MLNFLVGFVCVCVFLCVLFGDVTKMGFLAVCRSLHCPCVCVNRDTFVNIYDIGNKKILEYPVVE